MPHATTDQTFDTDVLKSPLPVLVDFWAPWCGPCKMMLPVIEELEKEYAGKMTFVKVNVDENQDIPGKFNIMSIPTFIFFKGGQPVAQFIGAKSKESVVQEIEKVLA